MGKENVRKAPRSSHFCVEVSAPLAMFTSPVSKQNCEKDSYPYPTYSALKAMMDRIYFRPGIVWIIDKVRIMNEIKTENRFVGTPSYKMMNNIPHGRFRMNYLSEVRYQILAHYKPDPRFFSSKHYHTNHDKQIEAAIGRGTSLLWAGTSDCPATYFPADFGAGEGFYDHYGEAKPVHMFFRFGYKYRTGRNMNSKSFADIIMRNGVIDFEEAHPIVIKENIPC